MRAILLGGALALLISLLGTRVAINQFRRLGYGQQIRDDGPTSHHTKRGTPTMGGVVIILATLVGYFGAKLITRSAPTASALLLLFLFVGMGLVGFLDDYIKIAKQRSLRPAQQGQDDRPDRGRAGVRRRSPLSPWLEDDDGRHPGLDAHLVPARDRVAGAAHRRGDAAHLVHRHRDQQRREPHRRPRRPGRPARR